MSVRALEAGNRARMGGMATDMTEPFPPDDKPAEAKALQGAVDKMADELAAQIKKAAQNIAQHGKIFHIRLVNAPDGFAPVVYSVLKRLCDRAKKSMQMKNLGSFTCRGKKITMPRLEAGLSTGLDKKFPGKSHKMEKKGQLLMVVF